MCEELICEDGGVGVDLDEVYGYCGDLGEHDSAERVGEGEGGVAQDEIDGVGVRLRSDVNNGEAIRRVCWSYSLSVW